MNGRHFITKDDSKKNLNYMTKIFKIHTADRRPVFDSTVAHSITTNHEF